MATAPLSQLSQELVGWHEERVLLEDSADDGHGMGSHDVDDRITTKLGKIVRANNGITSVLGTKFALASYSSTVSTPGWSSAAQSMCVTKRIVGSH